MAKLFRLSKSASVLCMLALPLGLSAQNYTKQCAEADILFPKSERVLLNRSCRIDINHTKDSIEFVATHNEVNYVRKNGRFYGKESIFYSSEFCSLMKVDAFTYNMNTNKKTPFKGYESATYFSSNIFYDDNREAYFVYPSLDDNCVTSVEYKIDYSEPRIIPPYYFSYSDPFLSSSLTVSFPKDCEIGWLVKDHGQYNIQFEQKIVKGKNEYTWTLTNTSLQGEANDDNPISKVYPHVIVWIKKYNSTKGERSVLSSIDDLYGWYSSLVKRAKTKDTLMVKQLTDSLTLGKNTDMDKADAIFQWVQNNISYVAIEDGYSGFIPRKADDVIRKKYGDCKDMANLLVEMMKNCKLDARHVWIGTRDIPYTYYDIHTPIVDNHMIAAVHINDQYYFLDATGKYMPFGLPTSMIQGKVAMIENQEGFLLEKVGVSSWDKSCIKDSVEVVITDKKIISSGQYTMKGYPLIFAKYELSYAKNNDEHDFYQQLLMKGSNKFKLTGYKLAEPITDQMVVNYQFELEDYVPSSDKELFVNMNVSKSEVATIDTKNDFLPVVSTNDYQYMKEDVVKLMIPANYTLNYTPENTDITTDYLTYSCTYELKNGYLVMKRKLIINYLELDKNKLTEFNKTVKQIQKIERNNVSLVTSK